MIDDGDYQLPDTFTENLRYRGEVVDISSEESEEEVTKKKKAAAKKADGEKKGRGRPRKEWCCIMFF